MFYIVLINIFKRPRLLHKKFLTRFWSKRDIVIICAEDGNGGEWTSRPKYGRIEAIQADPVWSSGYSASHIIHYTVRVDARDLRRWMNRKLVNTEAWFKQRYDLNRTLRSEIIDRSGRVYHKGFLGIKVSKSHFFSLSNVNRFFFFFLLKVAF